MHPLVRLLLAVGSVLLAWGIYLQWLSDYTNIISWYPYLMIAAWFSMFLLFLRPVKRGEVGYLELFGEDMKTECGQGWYLLPSLAPFMQDFDLVFGFDIVRERLSSLGSIAGNPNFRHLYNQVLSSLQIRATTDSLLKANIVHDLNVLKSKIFSLRDDEGRVKYYKLGMILYVLCWMFAFIGNLGNHASRITNQAVAAINSVVSSAVQGNAAPQDIRQEIEVYVELNKGVNPVWPDRKYFIPTREKGIQYFDTIEGKNYILFPSPSPGSVPTVVIEEEACAIIPAGREVRFYTDRPPKFAGNMEISVDYTERMLPFDHTKYLDSILTKPSRASWEYLYDNWKHVEIKRQVLTARAMSDDKLRRLSELPDGGLVCF